MPYMTHRCVHQLCISCYSQIIFTATDSHDKPMRGEAIGRHLVQEGTTSRCVCLITLLPFELVGKTHVVSGRQISDICLLSVAKQH